MKRILIACMLLLAQVCVAQVSQQEIKEFFLDYVEALKSGDYARALDHWSLLDRSNTDALGIRYLNTPMKLDAGSPLLSHIDLVRDGIAQVVVDTVTMSRDFARISYHLVIADSSLAGTYYAVTTATVEPALTTALRVFTESWDHAGGRYFDLTYRDPSLMERSNVDETDQFIERTARTLQIAGDKMQALEERKLRAFLCESYGEVNQLTGRMALGEFAKREDAVVSKFSPAYHEIARFLVAYANDSLPLYTLPLMEYGTATFLGGRWGRSPEVMLYLGSYIHLNNFAEWDKLMTYDGFMVWESNSDFSYPVAGLFCKFLFTRLGKEKYFDVYRRLSGSESEVKGITAEKFKEVIAAAVGVKWADLEKEFAEMATLENYAGISADALERGQLIYESGLPGFVIRVLQDSTHYNFHVALKSGDVKVALLTGQPPSQRDPFQSFLFKEHFPDTLYAHQHYGVIFSANEVGTYDFFTNVITGKYSVGFGGGEPIAKPASKEYRFRIEKRLLQNLEKESLKLVLMK